MQTRRRYLAAASLAIAGLAGCLSDDPGGTGTDDSPTTDDTTDLPGSTDDGTTDGQSTDAAAVTVSDPVVRKRVTHYSWPGSTGVLAPRGEQFVVASVTGPENAPPPAFTLHAGGETFSPGVEVSGRHAATFAGRTGGSVTKTDEAPGYLAFRVPSPLDVDDARIVRDDDVAATALPDAELATLRRPAAEFELDALTVPDAVERPELVDVSLSVTNVSDVDGRFLAALHWPTDRIADDDETTVYQWTVAAGETTSFSPTLETRYAVSRTSDHPLTISGSVSARRTIQVTVDDTTTAGSHHH
jgi:hypothetical protein